MAKQTLFEYAVIYHPKPKKAAEGEEQEVPKSELVIEPTFMLAFSEREVGFKVNRLLDAKYADKIDQLDIIIRPF